MKQLSITIPQAQVTYPMFIGSELVEKITELVTITRYSNVFFITDETVEKIILPKLINSLSIKPAICVLNTGETAKNSNSLQVIWKAMHSVGCDRKTLVICLGGGVISDLGGFAAATYMRGVDHLLIPTTLLSQVDASIGGKTGIDFLGIKNLIGSFHQPVGVIIDIQTLETLPKRELLAGFAEIIKHGLIADKAYFEQITKKSPLEFSSEELEEVITRSCEIKAAIIVSDPKESGKRKLLNFGHTIGHAIEVISLQTNYPLLHGEAIGLGMVAEAKISELLGMLSYTEFKQIRGAIKDMGLPTTFKQLKTNQIVKKMLSDKKNERGIINFTLLKGIGRAICDQQVPENIIEEALAIIKK